MTEGTKIMEVKGYFADDGKFFTDKDECKDYEMRLLMKKISDIIFDSDFNNNPEYIEDIIYFTPKTKEDINIFLTINNYYGYSVESISLDSPVSIYKFDTDYRIYIDMLQQYKELTAEINSIAPNTISENIF